MKNLIKYQLRDKLAETIIFAVGLILINIVLILKVNAVNPQISMSISAMLLGGASSVVFISNVLLFSKDLTEDTGYLIYSTPNSINKVLLSKLIVSFIQIAIVEIVAVSTFFTVALNIDKNFITKQKIFESLFSAAGIMQILTIAIIYISTLLIIYCSISFSHMLCKVKKLNTIFSIVFFIISNIIYYKIMEYITMLSSKAICINSNGVRLFNQSTSTLIVSRITGTELNLAGGLFVIIFIIIMFLGTSYMIKNKVDLK